MPRPEKVQSVQEIAGRFRDAEAALLTEYRGLHVGDIAEVRAALREAGADYKVLKNTLARIAVRDVGLDELVGMLEGPTAIAFCNGDAVAAAKALDDAARKFPVLVIKGGVLQGKVIGGDQAQRLAKLESREIQLGKIVTLVATPLQQMANVLAAPLRDLGSMLAQVLAKKESGELETLPAEAPAAREEGPGEAVRQGTQEAQDQEVAEVSSPAETSTAGGEVETGGMSSEPASTADPEGAPSQQADNGDQNGGPTGSGPGTEE